MEPLKLLTELAPGQSVKWDDVTDYYGEYDSDAEAFIFTEAYSQLSEVEQLFVVLHEISHYRNSSSHDDEFYECLTNLLHHYKVPFSVACRLEQIYPIEWEKEESFNGTTE